VYQILIYNIAMVKYSNYWHKDFLREENQNFILEEENQKFNLLVFID
jgi:hypothetical protein